MIEKNSKTKQSLENLSKNFTEEIYQNYVNGDLKYSDMCKQFNVSDYEMSTFFKENGYLKRRSLLISSRNENIFDEINSEESAYIFGLYMADGCITSKDYFQISLNKLDLEILEKVKNILSPASKLRLTKKHTNNFGITTNPMYVLLFKNKHISDTLNKYGCGYNKTYLEKSIKDIIPEKYMWHFIRGYFDGDGCISNSNVTKIHTLKSGGITTYTHNNTGFTIVSKTKNILDEIKSFMEKEGISAYVYSDSTNTKYLVGTHSFEEIKKVYNKLYLDCTLFMKRKKDKFDKIMEIPR